jgi:hypothetical protein
MNSGTLLSRALRCLLTGIFLFTCAAAGRGATYRVTNVNDDGPGTLRAAVGLANQNNDEDEIVFDRAVFAGTNSIVLTTGELIVTTPLRIIGPGTDRLSISGNNSSRVFFSAKYGDPSFK